MIKGSKHSEESKQKTSKSKKGKKLGPQSEEHKNKISKTKKGKPGHPQSEETKLKISNTLKGRKQPEEAIRKSAEAKRGKPRSEETKRKISETCKGENHSCWKGGVSRLNIPLYGTYASRLEKYEEVRCTEEGYLEVKCAYCGKWFLPKISAVGNRIGAINGDIKGDRRLYCSNSCKSECPIYGRKSRYKGQEGVNSREVQPELRQLVFLRDGYECQKCGATESLHCHHYEGILYNPIESADIDNCITLCKKCHINTHKQSGCTYSDLKCR